MNNSVSLTESHFLKTALRENGYEKVSDLISVASTDLATELSVGVPQADDILRQAKAFTGETSTSVNELEAIAGRTGASQLRSQRASDLLQSQDAIRFSTLSTAIDDLLAHFSPCHRAGYIPTPNLKGKGRALTSACVVPGMVVEFSGPPGSGKTSVALSLALSGRCAGDTSAEILMIDTEGSITPQRMERAAERLQESLSDEAISDEILRGVHLIRVATQVQMLATLHTLDAWLEQHPKVRLVVVDTLSYHFRQPSLELGARKRAMELAKQVLGKAATVRNCAVVVTTQMATKLLTAENKRANFETGERAVLMPQLGDLWTTERTVRVALFRGPAGDDMRYAYATVYAHAAGSSRGSDLPWASFDIDTDGLPCDIPPAPTQ